MAKLTKLAKIGAKLTRLAKFAKLAKIGKIGKLPKIGKIGKKRGKIGISEFRFKFRLSKGRQIILPCFLHLFLLVAQSSGIFDHVAFADIAKLSHSSQKVEALVAGRVRKKRHHHPLLWADVAELIRNEHAVFF